MREKLLAELRQSVIALLAEQDPDAGPSDVPGFSPEVPRPKGHGAFATNAARPQGQRRGAPPRGKKQLFARGPAHRRTPKKRARQQHYLFFSKKTKKKPYIFLIFWF